MFQNSIYIGRIFGIPVRLHLSWLIIFVLLTVSLALGFGAENPRWKEHNLHWVLAAVASVFFFASVLVHELAHSLVARRRGLSARSQ